jgi:hypothetical protein
MDIEQMGNWKWDTGKSCNGFLLSMQCLHLGGYKNWREMIFTLFVHNNCTYTIHIEVGSSVWAPPQCVLCEYSCYEDDVQVSFPKTE